MQAGATRPGRTDERRTTSIGQVRSTRTRPTRPRPRAASEGPRRIGPSERRPQAGRRERESARCPRPTAVRARQPPCCSQRARASGCGPPCRRCCTRSPGHPARPRVARGRGARARAPRRRRRPRARSGRRRGRRRSATGWDARWRPRCRSSSSAPATPCGAGSRRCRPALTGAVLVTYGDVPLLDATHPAGPARRARRGRRGRHAADRRVRRPHRLRAGAARAGRHGHRDRRAGRRDGRGARRPRGQQRGLRLRRRVPRRRPGRAGDATTRRASCT